ncbi:MAG: transglycosylase domain-containing protein, partial [Nitrospirae bacterium]|nr:transglycosylase domain-containing protein [Nitrospirota bacterium]
MKRFIVSFLLVIIAVILGSATGGYLALVRGIPEIDEIKNYQPTAGTRIYADDDVLIGEFKLEKGIYLPFKKIPEAMIKSVVAVEDSRFWLHKGIDYVAILRALLKDILAGGIKEGGSTITQQLAKAVFLSPEKKFTRKLKEAILAFRIENNLTKEEILELYLNRIYFGQGAYGLEMAARKYFGKSASDIDLAESALLAGLVKAPSKYSPYNNFDKAKERQRVVLLRMQEEGYITKEQAEEIHRQPLYLSSLSHEESAPNYFLDYVRKYLEDKYGSEAERITGAGSRPGKINLKPGDILTAQVIGVTPAKATVKTRGVAGSLLLEDAQWAERLVDARGNLIKKFKPLRLTDILKSGDIITVQAKSVPDKEPVFTLEQEPIAQGALVAIEPSTGYIRALAGGYDFSKSEFNRAVYARRQAGSAFKPIIYAAAMDAGYTPASIIVDEPVVYPNKTLGDWAPENYDRKFHGPTRLREALAYSRNIVTIKLLERIGVQRTINFAE